MSWKKICTLLHCCKKKEVVKNPERQTSYTISVAQIHPEGRRHDNTSIDIHEALATPTTIEYNPGFNTAAI